MALMALPSTLGLTSGILDPVMFENYQHWYNL
jgi:hypothetical protein